MRIHLLLFLSIFFTSVFGQTRESILLNNNWNLVYGFEVSTTAGKLVQLPHTWNSDDALTGNKAYYRGQASYQKKMVFDKKWEEKRLFLKFDGVNTIANLFINGKHVGEHRGGYSAFVFEITDKVKFGEENSIQVRVSNALQLDVMPLVGDFVFYGGIYRDVNLIVTDKSCISLQDYASSGVYLEQKKVTKELAEVNAKVLVNNGNNASENYIVKLEVLDGSKTIISQQATINLSPNTTAPVTLPIILNKPHLWNGRKDPFMYKTVVTLLQNGKLKDIIEQPLGLRFYRVDANKGFFLNGEHLQLRGVCRHQDYAEKGNALLPQDHENDIAIMKEIGANAIRLSHYPQAPYFYDLLDKNGFVTWSEIPFVGPGGYRDQGYVNQLRFRENGTQQLIEMIRQNYNRPGICFWGLFNELKIDEENPVDYIKELNALAKAEDPTRLTTAASCFDDIDINEVTDLIAWNKYFGWYGGEPKQIGVWSDVTHAKHPNSKIAISEYGAGASIFHHQDELIPSKPGSYWHPEAWQAIYHEENWQAINARRYIWGSFIWNLFDFAAAHRTEGDRTGRNDKGLVTFDRATKKDAWWFYKATWNKEEPVLYIANRRFVSRTNALTLVKVYSNLEQVELFVNGISLGKKKVIDAIVQWDNVRLAKGENKIAVKSGKGKTALSDECSWLLE
ncbi:MAG: glycoside hydrolase family 2 TIM barrel-domain containing protein [Bacteroidales bacterium]